MWPEGHGFAEDDDGMGSHSVVVVEGVPGLRLYLKGLKELLTVMKQNFPGEQGFVGEAK